MCGGQHQVVTPELWPRLRVSLSLFAPDGFLQIPTTPSPATAPSVRPATPRPTSHLSASPPPDPSTPRVTPTATAARAVSGFKCHQRVLPTICDITTHAPKGHIFLDRIVHRFVTNIGELRVCPEVASQMIWDQHALPHHLRQHHPRQYVMSHHLRQLTHTSTSCPTSATAPPTPARPAPPSATTPHTR